MGTREIYEIISRISRKNLFLKKIIYSLSDMQLRWRNRLPDDEYAKKTYYMYNREPLNLENPKTFNEKLWWLKFHYRNPLEKICSDKYRVREYAAQCGLSDIMVELKGVYDSPEEVPFDEFTEETFVKINVGSGANILYKPGAEFNRKFFLWDFGKKMKHDWYQNSREWNFKDVQPKIICEKVLRDKNGELPTDWKFMCFGGTPRLVFFSSGACDASGRHSVDGQRYTNVYDMDFHYVPIESSYPTRPDLEVQKPDHFELMKQYAAILSAPFPHCRVDFYNIEGKIYLGEITFYHSGGCGNIAPKEWADRMGSWIDLDAIPSDFLI